MIFHHLCAAIALTILLTTGCFSIVPAGAGWRLKLYFLRSICLRRRCSSISRWCSREAVFLMPAGYRSVVWRSDCIVHLVECGFFTRDDPRP